MNAILGPQSDECYEAGMKLQSAEFASDNHGSIADSILLDICFLMTYSRVSKLYLHRVHHANQRCEIWMS